MIKPYPFPQLAVGLLLTHRSELKNVRILFVRGGRDPPEETVWDTPAHSFSAYQGGEVPRGLGRGHGLWWIKPDLGAYCQSENRMYCVP